MKNWGTMWADQHIERLKSGETVQFRPHGNSMVPKIQSGQLVTVAPLDREPLVDDIVLCKVGRAQYVHLVKAVQGDRVQIGNNKGRINGWTSRQNVFGIVVRVDP